MTAVVFLRWRFGYSYLQPISSFITLAWALILFIGVAWVARNDYPWWDHSKWLCFFALSSIVMFFIHYLIAYFSVYLRKGAHDNHSGTSLLGANNPNSPYSMTKICTEPVVVFLIGAVLYFFSQETVLLGIWLFLTAIAMSIKETLNFWHLERKIQQGVDARAEAEQTIFQTGTHRKAPIRSKRNKPTRKKAQSRREQKSNEPNDAKLAIHYAEMLNLQLPYNFQRAQKAYREKLKELHPDTNSSDDPDLPEDAPQFAELRKALNFFKTYN